MNEIKLGTGKVFMSHFHMKDSGEMGILFESVSEEHPIDSTKPGFVPGEEYYFKETDFVIWCNSLESVRVLQDAVNSLALELNGRVVDKEVENETTN